MVVVVASGLPGAGKSTFFRKLYNKPKIVSADHFFMIDCPLCATSETQEEGMDEVLGTGAPCGRCHGTREIYQFEPGRLGDAHADCLRKFLDLVTVQNPDYDAIIVDNTNTTVVEIAPYVALAQAYGHQSLIVTLKCDLVTSMARNRHNVPEEVLRKMIEQLQNRTLPAWWKHIQLTVE